jgi:hypothetical protein
MLFHAALGAVFVQVLLTFCLLFWMSGVRGSAVKRGEIKIRDIALDDGAWDPRSKQVANSYANQFEMPVLFYAVVAFAMIVRQADLIFVVLAWLYVLARIVHAYIHTTSNHVPTRRNAFAASVFILIVMWGYFAFQVLVVRFP